MKNKKKLQKFLFYSKCMEAKISGFFQRVNGWCELIKETYCSTSFMFQLRAERVVAFILLTRGLC